MAAGAGSHSPCGACKFLRRKCAADCIFAPYFCSEQGPARFAAIHKVFGASNVSKLLLHLPVHHRYEAVVTIAYEAQARIRDPVYGCVAHIFALQQQVAYLQAQVMQVKAQIASNNLEANQWQTGMISNPCINNINMQTPVFQNQRCSGGLEAVNNNNNISNTISYMNMNPISPQSSLESIDQQQSNMSDGMSMMMAMHELGAVIQTKAEGIIGKKRPYGDVGELQEMALRMMRDY